MNETADGDVKMKRQQTAIEMKNKEGKEASGKRHILREFYLLTAHYHVLYLVIC